MEYIGIDLGSRQSHICIRHEDAQIQLETRVKTRELGAWLEAREAARVIVETCTEAFAVADLAIKYGHKVSVVPAAVVRQLGVGHRGLKNDRRDAQVLSRAAIALGDELPSVHIPSARSRQVNRLLVQRAGLVKARTQLVNGVKSALRTELIVLKSGSTSTFPARVREELSGRGDELGDLLEPTLEALERLTASIGVFDSRVQAESQGDETMRRLKSVPGVGPIVAAAFVSAIDGVERFEDAAHLASYLGLTPGECSTGGKARPTRITRAGKAQLRTLLIQASWTHVRVARYTALTGHYDRLVRGRLKQVAIVATARKLACLLYAMCRDKAPYDPRRNLPTPLPQDDIRAELQAAIATTM